MKTCSQNIQNDKKLTKKHAESTSSRQGLMLKMATSYSVFLFVILILFFYLYASVSRNALSQYQWQQKSTLMGNVKLFEKDLDIMDAYCRQFLQNNTFKKLAKASDTGGGFHDAGAALASDLATGVYPEALLPIAEVFCYLPKSGYILGPGYFVPLGRYYNEELIPDYTPGSYEKWLETLTSPSNFYHFTPMDDFILGNSLGSGRQYYMYTVNLDDMYYLNIDAIVCFLLEKEALSSLFGCMADSEYRYLSVYNGQNENILSISTQQSANFDSLASDGTLEDARQYLADLGVSIGKYQSEDTGYIYYFSYPSFESTSNFARPQILYLTLFGAALVGGAGLIFLLSKRNMQPIIALDNELQAAELEKSNLIQEKSDLMQEKSDLMQEKSDLMQEKSDLMQEKSDLQEEKDYLQEVMDNQRPIICNSYVRLLLKGLIASKEEAAYAKDFLGLKEDGLTFNALYVIAYNNVADGQLLANEPHADILLTPDECNAIVMENLKKYTGERFYCFSPSDRVYALILVGKAEDETDLVIRTNEMIVHMHNDLLDNYGIWLFAGIGKNTEDIMNVWESYQQAQEAVNYTSNHYIFLPYEFIKKDSSTFYYPMELSSKLIHFITTGNTPQVFELFGLLHQENIEERSLPINMLQFLLSDIRNTLLKARFALPAGTPADAVRALDECFNQHASFKLCEDIALKLCQLFTVESDDSSLISAVEKYIKENYSDPSMGLNKISDAFQISESYFSHMFKEKTGVNFSTYLENIRMNEAAWLIRETNISLNELYITIGYNNANSFRRAFKKVYGMTPSAMRDARNS